jgi:hypothetical protein
MAISVRTPLLSLRNTRAARALAGHRRAVYAGALFGISTACSSGTAEPISSAGPLANQPINTVPMEPGPMPTRPPMTFGSPVMGGTGETTERYAKADVTRDDQNYFLMANGWGPKFESHTITWSGTSFNVVDLQGQQGGGYEPATYPTVFCGVYSDSESKACGLPAALDQLTSLRTGWSWAPADVGSNQQYNAAYDVWLANGTTRADFSGFFMVWLREPPGQQPAGSLSEHRAVAVANVPGTWNIWTGQVNKAPIINYVRDTGDDTFELEFDVMDFVRDAQERGLEIPGTHVLSVAVGFEIWNGPVTNLRTVDFYVDPVVAAP